MIVHHVARHTDTVVNEGMGSRPIAAFILARYELRIDDAVFVPFGQQLESFFHFWLNRIHRHIFILHGVP
ncbi:hypothetical protein D3C85_1872060 [compost metagenome]